ncbi:MAG: SusC/RagA family TonB-linked outer membrane protein, partial [Candidatus Cryptobacteroides sp.]
KSCSSTDELFTQAFETPPFVHPAIYSDGTIPRASAFRSNPWAICTQNGYYRTTKSKLESLFSLEQNLKMVTPGLKLKLTFAFDTYNENSLTRSKTPDYYSVAKVRDDEGNLQHSIITYGQEFLGYSSGGSYGNNSTYFEATLTYTNSFGNHDVDALLLYNQRSYDWGDIQPKRTQGIAGRLSYTYDRRYVGEFNFGYNGSENFAKGQRFGFFPSVALGWLLSEEHFMEPYKRILSKFKFRASVGSVGNDDIGGSRRFAYLTTINSNAAGYNFGYDGGQYFSGVQEGEVGVADLTWERSLKSNIGLEIGLWNAFSFQFDIFKERRTNIFMQRSTIPTQTGFLSTPYANYGKVDNQGLEAQISYSKRFNDDWSLSLRGTFTYAKNKIIEIDEPETIKGTYRSITGQSIGTLWGLTALGLYTEDDFDASGNLKPGLPVPALGTAPRPGDIKYEDKNLDGVINDVDEGYIGGTSMPPCIYGFGGTLMWKGLDFSFFFQGQAEVYRIIGGSEYFIPGSGQGVLGNVYANYTDCWSESNQSQNVFWPRLSATTNTHNNRASTWWKKDMSFLRCKTLELGYTIPQRLTKKAHINNVRFYLSGNNLFYFSKFKLWDPELDTTDGLKYPSMRSVMLGLNISF